MLASWVFFTAVCRFLGYAAFRYRLRTKNLRKSSEKYRHALFLSLMQPTLTRIWQRSLTKRFAVAAYGYGFLDCRTLVALKSSVTLPTAFLITVVHSRVPGAVHFHVAVEFSPSGAAQAHLIIWESPSQPPPSSIWPPSALTIQKR